MSNDNNEAAYKVGWPFVIIKGFTNGIQFILCLTILLSMLFSALWCLGRPTVNQCMDLCKDEVSNYGFTCTCKE